MKSVFYRVGMTAACLLVAASAHAQATRTWVSGVGDDANPCSRTAPCKTFAGAISKTAAGGLINVLDPGGFGAVTVTKSITIDGGPFRAGILAAGTNGVVINGAGIEVYLRNLQIEGNNLGVSAGLNGVQVINAGRIYVENCVIQQFSQKGINFNSSSSSHLYVDNTTFIGNTGGGIIVLNGRADVSNSRFHRNQAFGLEASTNGLATVSDSVASGGSIGFAAAVNSSAVLNLTRSVATHNDFGVVGSQSATVRVDNSKILSNTTNGIFSDGTATMITFSNNTIDGNPANSAFTQTKQANQ